MPTHGSSSAGIDLHRRYFCGGCGSSAVGTNEGAQHLSGTRRYTYSVGSLDLEVCSTRTPEVKQIRLLGSSVPGTTCREVRWVGTGPFLGVKSRKATLVRCSPDVRP